ncbi:unnamed protein product [Cochlearia groenlandica]
MAFRLEEHMLYDQALDTIVEQRTRCLTVTELEQVFLAAAEAETDCVWPPVHEGNLEARFPLSVANRIPVERPGFYRINTVKIVDRNEMIPLFGIEFQGCDCANASAFTGARSTAAMSWTLTWDLAWCLSTTILQPPASTQCSLTLSHAFSVL